MELEKVFGHETLIRVLMNKSYFSHSRRPSKRLEDTLRKFTDFALPFHLDMIIQHRNNIDRVRDKDSFVKRLLIDISETAAGNEIVFF